MPGRFQTNATIADDQHMNDPDYILDLAALQRRPMPGSPRQAPADSNAAAPALQPHSPAAPAGAGSGRETLVGRPWVAIQFKCCRCYTRIYRNRKATAYEGQCPKCGRRVKLKIGNNGTNQRFFEAV